MKVYYQLNGQQNGTKNNPVRRNQVVLNIWQESVAATLFILKRQTLKSTNCFLIRDLNQ